MKMRMMIENVDMAHIMGEIVDVDGNVDADENEFAWELSQVEASAVCSKNLKAM